MRPVSSREDPGSRPGGALKLLIVEDESSTVFAMCEFFSFSGYRVDCAADAIEAAAFLERSRYDVVITDLHLTPNRCAEGMNVLTSARYLNPEALIVMLTAYASEGSERDAYDAGVNLYETKPIGLADLVTRIDAARKNGAPVTPPGAGGDCGGECPR
jgi:DNA-binding response OmpR family regulator